MKHLLILLSCSILLTACNCGENTDVEKSNVAEGMMVDPTSQPPPPPPYMFDEEELMKYTFEVYNSHMNAEGESAARWEFRGLHDRQRIEYSIEKAKTIIWMIENDKTVIKKNESNILETTPTE